jgi:hypothetical protein
VSAARDVPLVKVDPVYKRAMAAESSYWLLSEASTQGVRHRHASKAPGTVHGIVDGQLAVCDEKNQKITSRNPRHSKIVRKALINIKYCNILIENLTSYITHSIANGLVQSSNVKNKPIANVTD